MGDEELLVEAEFRTFRVRVDSFRLGALTDAQQAAGRRLGFELRFGLDNADPHAVRDAQRLQHALVEPGQVHRAVEASPDTQGFFNELAEYLEQELEAGRLLVLEEAAIANVPEQELTVRRPPVEAAPPGELSPRRALPLETSFEVRFVDEVGQAISGLSVQIEAGDRVEEVKTNAAGLALLEGTSAGSGTVSVLDSAALETILVPRWGKQRLGKAPLGLNTTEQVFDSRGVAPTTIKAGTENTVVLKPRLGTLAVELWDKSGRVPHANRDYTIDGPTPLSGKTDEQGRAFHEQVLPGDYTLSLTVKSFEGADQVIDTYTTALVVQSA